ncbi:MAG: PHP domain-containing protein, partial [Pseudomonadota bacterium]
MADPFVHLHLHSAYSLLEGAIKVAKLKELCLAAKMPAVAVTDTNNLFGALEVSTTLAGAGIQSISGLQQAIAAQAFGLHETRGARLPSLVELRIGQPGILQRRHREIAHQIGRGIALNHEGQRLLP